MISWSEIMIEKCPSEEDLICYARDKVSADERARIEAHLEVCATCRELVVFAFHLDETITHPFRKPPTA
jgi:anti-sigma factor ChrR (cupin superfamily)